MDSKIFKNSYVVFAISFVTFYALFYLLGIGLVTEIVNDKPVVKTSWRYPLGLSVILWTFWHFYMYPPDDIKYEKSNKSSSDSYHDSPREDSLGFHQKINLQNWH
jgi:hypothetical protein